MYCKRQTKCQIISISTLTERTVGIRAIFFSACIYVNQPASIFPPNYSTLFLKKVSTFKLSVTFSNLNRFSTSCTTGKRIKFATNPYDITHLTLGILLHYLRKLKIQIFCIYSANMEESANKFHFKKLLTFKFVWQPLCYVPIQIQTFYQNLVFIHG